MLYFHKHDNKLIFFESGDFFCPKSNKFKQTNKINKGWKFDQNQCCADANDWKEISFGTHQRLTNPHFSRRTRHHNLDMQNSRSNSVASHQAWTQFKQTHERDHYRIKIWSKPMLCWCRWLKRNLVWHTSEANKPTF